MRTLIAGFGNVLRGDDGFGVEVIRRLQEREPISDVEVMEVGTAGIRLAQELLTPCDRLIIVDAMNRGGTPGTVYVVRVESVDAAAKWICTSRYRPVRWPSRRPSGRFLPRCSS